MFSTGLLAVMMVVAPQDVPLSPAKLSPPPMPAPTAVGSGVQIGVSYGPINATLEVCREKALAAVASQPGFQFAEVNAANQIEGYLKTCRIAVLVEPAAEGSFVYVLASSRVGDSEFVARGIRDRIDSAPADPKKAKRAGTPDAALEKTLMPLVWHLESRAVSDLCRHYVPVAALVFEKRGFKLHPPAPHAFTAEKLSKQLSCVCVAGGVKGASINAVYASTGPDLDPVKAAQELKDISAAIGKIVFE